MAIPSLTLPSSVWTFAVGDPESAEQLARCYEVWKGIWQRTFAEVGERRGLASDSFLHAELCHSYWYNGEPVGSILLSEYHAAAPGLADLSAFRGWPPEFLVGLGIRRIKHFGVLSHLGVLEQFRKNHLTPSVSHALLEQAIIHSYRKATYDHLFMLVRNSRGVSKICQSLGGKVILSTNHHGEPSDVVHVNLKTFKL
jgi:hypothetical protein